MNGYEVCNALQDSPNLAAVPVIFLTARGELNDKLVGFEAGGADYLTKPFKMVELKARIGALLRQTQRNRLLGRKQESDRTNLEMDEAAMIQRTLMTCNVGDVQGVEVAAHCQPARLVGGDLYDVYPRPDGRLSIVEADVSGKGMPAAMVTAEVRTVLRETTKMIASPAAALALANRRLYDDLTEVGKMVTVFVAYYDSETRTVTYANAGHSVVAYAPAGAPPTVLEATGVPFGIFDDTDFGEETLALGPGDLLVISSDGFAEAHNAAGELFGYDRLLAAIETAAVGTAEEISSGISEIVGEFVQGHEQSDDQTLIVLRGKE
jgi:serine phosphatase RsbU (regulator of sigma subunit)